MSSRLAINGGRPCVQGQLPRFDTINNEEIRLVSDVLRHGILSGYIGGKHDRGPMVRQLEHDWQQEFGVEHAIACNSATSGLLAACAAIGVKNKNVVTTPFTMSATAAAPKLLGAKVSFCDIEPSTFNIDPCKVPTNNLDVIIAVNLFGHPAQLEHLRSLCVEENQYLIEDNAQAPYALHDKLFTGTVGHLGVFSLNVHKHLQCGEGGIVVTDDDALAYAVRNFINHGELAGDAPGLNLRMTEVTAAIAQRQLMKGPEIVEGRVELALQLNDCINGLPYLRKPVVIERCRHVYYAWPILVDDTPEKVMAFRLAMNAEGVPLRAYSMPLYRLPAFRGLPLPVTEDIY